MERGFFFDVGGVLIPDRFGEDARAVFDYLAERYTSLDAKQAYRVYSDSQPGLDLGAVPLDVFCEAIRLERSAFEKEWLAMHPVNQDVIRVIEQLLAQGYAVGLATNFCRRLLNVLLERTPVLRRLRICCSADIGIIKPAAEFFASASKIIAAGEVVFVDDRSINVAAARKFGWVAIEANRGWLSRFEEVYVLRKENIRP